ncbi:hypothetical protein TNCV_988911 [Trichonephila clavipes]|nr:hypothetical protein TNCV_988911 [Trichonephila clavipes]
MEQIICAASDFVALPAQEPSSGKSLLPETRTVMWLRNSAHPSRLYAVDVQFIVQHNSTETIVAIFQ